MSIQLLLLLAYSAGLIVLGLWIGRRVAGTSAFFVAGRSLSAPLLGATLLAANIGAGSTVGAAGLGFRDGLSAWWWVGSAGLGTLVLAFWIGPRIWEVARRHDLQTVGDFLELRFGAAVRGTVAALLWVGTLAILAGQLIAVGKVLAAVADLPPAHGAMIGGLVMTAYFTAGGLLTSAWVNLVQLVVLLAGFGLALPLALSRVGGVAALGEATSAETWRAVSEGSSPWLLLPLLLPAFIVSPGLLQKIYGARNRRAVRRGVALAGLALLLFAFMPVLLGIIARVLHPELADGELALPVLLANDLPLALGTLGLAAVFSAEISSADAILFMLSTSLSRDLYRRFVRPQASDAQVLAVARWAAVAGGLLGTLLAIWLPSVVASLTIFYSLLTVSLFVPLVAGLSSRLGGSREALAAIIAGVLGLLTARLLEMTNPTLVGLVASAIAFFAVLALPRRTASSESR